MELVGIVYKNKTGGEYLKIEKDEELYILKREVEATVFGKKRRLSEILVRTFDKNEVLSRLVEENTKTPLKGVLVKKGGAFNEKDLGLLKALIAENVLRDKKIEKFVDEEILKIVAEYSKEPLKERARKILDRKGIEYPDKLEFDGEKLFEVAGKVMGEIDKETPDFRNWIKESVALYLSHKTVEKKMQTPDYDVVMVDKVFEKEKPQLKNLIDVATFEIRDAVKKIVSNLPERDIVELIEATFMENIEEMKRGVKRKV